MLKDATAPHAAIVIGAMWDPDEDVREQALITLAELKGVISLGDNAMSRVSQLVEDTSRQISLEASKLLAKHGEAAMLVDAFNDVSEDVSIAALKAVAGLQDAAYQSDMVKIL